MRCHTRQWRMPPKRSSNPAIAAPLTEDGKAISLCICCYWLLRLTAGKCPRIGSKRVSTAPATVDQCPIVASSGDIPLPSPHPMALPDDGYPVCVHVDPDSGDIDASVQNRLVQRFFPWRKFRLEYRPSSALELVDSASKEPMEEQKKKNNHRSSTRQIGGLKSPKIGGSN